MPCGQFPALHIIGRAHSGSLALQLFLAIPATSILRRTCLKTDSNVCACVCKEYTINLPASMEPGEAAQAEVDTHSKSASEVLIIIKSEPTNTRPLLSAV